MIPVLSTCKNLCKRYDELKSDFCVRMSHTSRWNRPLARVGCVWWEDTKEHLGTFDKRTYIPFSIWLWTCKIMAWFIFYSCHMYNKSRAPFSGVCQPSCLASLLARWMACFGFACLADSALFEMTICHWFRVKTGSMFTWFRVNHGQSSLIISGWMWPHLSHDELASPWLVKP